MTHNSYTELIPKFRTIAAHRCYSFGLIGTVSKDKIAYENGRRFHQLVCVTDFDIQSLSAGRYFG